MKIKGATLGDLVTKVLAADYEQKYSLTANNRIWRMYVKESDSILKVAYVSDCCEVIITETFQKLHDEKEEQTAIEDIINRYDTGMVDVKEIQQRKVKEVFAYVVGGAVVVGLISKHIFGVVLGGLIGSGLYESNRRDKLKIAYKGLDTYLENHNIYIGKKALGQIKK